ncbi:MAG: hypothetical protein NWF01_03545 [Candidatus Bathyarchaeota archaeon]|nr:hypothetical protein [Candidatus Bathyarchaeota archaeon]
MNPKEKMSAVAASFVALGALCIILSVFYTNQILAFVGLGLIFWGAIFSFTHVGNMVEASFMDSTAKSNYSTLNRIMNNYAFTGKGYYIPAYPSDVVIPRYLHSLRESLVFITNESYKGPPSIDDMVKGKFLSSNTNGLFVTAPGYDLLSDFEAELKVDLSTVKSSDVFELLTRSIIESNLAKNVKISFKAENLVSLEVSPVIFQSLYVNQTNLQVVNALGCPVVSAVACALAKNFAKSVSIREQKVSGGKVEVLFEVLG